MQIDTGGGRSVMKTHSSWGDRGVVGAFGSNPNVLDSFLFSCSPLIVSFYFFTCVQAVAVSTKRIRLLVRTTQQWILNERLTWSGHGTFVVRCEYFFYYNSLLCALCAFLSQEIFRLSGVNDSFQFAAAFMDGAVATSRGPRRFFPVVERRPDVANNISSCPIITRLRSASNLASYPHLCSI